MAGALHIVLASAVKSRPIHEKFFSPNAMPPAVDEEISSNDPRLKSLTLRAMAAEEAVQAAKLYCRITHLETVAANLTLQSLKHKEEAESITSRGQYFYNKMKEQQTQLDRQKGPRDILAAEVIRNREKAMKLSGQAAAHEKKVSEAEQRVRTAVSEAGRLRTDMDRRLLDARKLEAQAIRIESLL